MAEVQLELPGIGCQKATLSDWKTDNGIFTHQSPLSEGTLSWTCWDEIECPSEFGHTYGFEAMGYGLSEKEAIWDYCEKENIDPPFWWR